MSAFLDGPARDMKLSLHRAPKYIRVTQDKSGKIDALDLLEDTPRDDERIYVYRATTGISVIFVDGWHKGKRWGDRYEDRDYRLLPLVNGEDFRDNTTWQEWANSDPFP